MKTYIMRDPKSVEPQNPLRYGPAATAALEAIPGRRDFSAHCAVQFIGYAKSFEGG